MLESLEQRKIISELSAKLLISPEVLCSIEFLPNNQQDQLVKLKISGLSSSEKENSRGREREREALHSCEYSIDAEIFKQSYLSALASDYVIDLRPHLAEDANVYFSQMRKSGEGMYFGICHISSGNFHCITFHLDKLYIYACRLTILCVCVLRLGQLGREQRRISAGAHLFERKNKISGR